MHSTVEPCILEQIDRAIGLQSFHTFGRYYKALQPLFLALFAQTISWQNIGRSVSQGKNERTGRDCNLFHQKQKEEKI